MPPRPPRGHRVQHGSVRDTVRQEAQAGFVPALFVGRSPSPFVQNNSGSAEARTFSFPSPSS